MLLTPPSQAEHDAAQGLADLREYCISPESRNTPQHNYGMTTPSSVTSPFENQDSNILLFSTFPEQKMPLNKTRLEPIRQVLAHNSTSIPTMALAPIQQPSHMSRHDHSPMEPSLSPSTKHSSYQLRHCFIHHHQCINQHSHHNHYHSQQALSDSFYDRLRMARLPTLSQKYTINKYHIYQQNIAQDTPKSIKSFEEEDLMETTFPIQNSPDSYKASKNGKEKPRWTAEMRTLLLNAVVNHKGLSDMTSFDWAAVGLEVGRSGKACKDQWRRAILPRIQRIFDNDHIE
ncbi:uncharacterized protein B0P05DRAFT_536143 [Gilbertella persicaria]|uniref:uncharacterized protein n=1 Tax=Gilbertella persicaria TaxID=101096 RepID=UPI00221F075F|nr:uncharacterized protein B0P05DRAFT_536143 [Gilbertella persicaria]KAI8084095.1 hypothetical protein B0P05DRAFT_536143 [Gilbertella persicaria]